MLRPVILTAAALLAASLAPLPAAARTTAPSVAAATAIAEPSVEQVPVTVDSSNQSGWWRPLDSFGGTDYFAYNAPASTAGRHEVHIASRAEDGTWRDGCLPDASGACVTYVDDVGHNQPSIVLDGEGVIHAFVSMHGDGWRYYRATRPGDVTSLTEASSTLPDAGLGFTYPVTARGKDGSAYVMVRAHRDAAAVRDGRLYRFDTAAHAWSRVAVIASGTNYSFYPDDLQVDAAGRVHVLWEWGPWPATTHRHLGSYAVFDPADGSWRDVTGAALTVPLAPGAGNAVVYQPYEDGETITSTSRAVQSAKLAVYGDQLAGIAYRYLTARSGSTFTGFDVRYASWDGAAWKRETVLARADHAVDNSATIGVTRAGAVTRIYFVAEAGGCGGVRSQVVRAERSGTGPWAFSALGDVRQGLQRLRAQRSVNGTDLLYVTAPVIGALWRATVPRDGEPGAGGPFSEIADRLLASGAGGLNVALNASVTVSSVLRAGTEGGKAVDGLCSDDSRWISAEGDTAPTITVRLARAYPISEIRVHSGYTKAPVPGTDVLRDFAVEAHTASGWQQVAAITGNTAGTVRVPASVTADQVRMSISDPSGNALDVARVYEIEVVSRG
ncbi:BNR-4 repeat-containing protein [Nonomuraea rhodomycinica]|uniref:BNR-4 repeat-containing protein n=1 Tax=Nonomuraea rhodomycinica TaxID=1712872 RepID=A0A7Y6MDM9_9ACTN|nr:BNR-4 repeat-containing protein [Nonomuraea rhodomycinica]NUW44072.1 BNR-4 repeat-containing protein [Nonomuraea rhodomycinica]